MAIYGRYKKSDYSPAPEGLHQAVCCDVIDLGMLPVTYKGVTKEKPMIKIRWQLEEIDPKAKRRFTVTKRYNNNLGTKANLRKDLETWRGRKFKEEELDKFDLEKLLGANCQLSISHNVKDEGEIYANVMTIVPINPKMKKITVSEDYEREKDRMQSVPDGSNGNGKQQGEWDPFADAQADGNEEYVPY